MKIIKDFYTLYKNNKKEVQLLKIIALVIINTWILIIFWKTLLIENVFIGNNMSLTKMNTVIQPVLMYLGLDMLSPNVIKIIILTTIILGANIMVLNFESIILMIIPLGIARYGYKSYTNYLINSENMMEKMNIKQELLPKVVEKATEQVPIIINNGGGTGGSNWILWTALGLGLCLCIGLMVWSHNTNANNIVELGENTVNLSNTLNTKIDNVNERVTRNISQIDYNNNYTTKMCNNVDTKIDLVNEKIKNLETGFQTFGEKIVKLEENNMENVKILSEETLAISKEAKEFFGNVMESNTASEALILTVAKIYDGFTILEENINTVNARLDSMAGATTPRSTMFRPNIPSRHINPTNININE